jgi:hypothetical protein
VESRRAATRTLERERNRRGGRVRLGRYFGFNVTAPGLHHSPLFLSGGGVAFVYLALMLLMPFAPLPSGHPPLRWLPAKCRGLMEFLRTKFHLATG